MNESHQSLYIRKPIMRRYGLKKAAFLSYLLDAYLDDPNGNWFHIPTAKVCRDLGLSREHVKRVRKGLRDSGLIKTRTEEGGKGNASKIYYRLNMQELKKMEKADANK